VRSSRALPALGVIALGVLLAACSGGASPSSQSSRSGATTTTVAHSYTRYAAAGPYAAGTVQYVVDGDPVVVWYPVSPAAVAGRTPYSYHLRAWVPKALAAFVPASFPDAVAEDAYQGVPAAPGSFPVVLFSHGYGGYPEQSTFLTAHLATWGMIVIAPDQQKRDLVAVIDGKGGPVEPPQDVTEQMAALAYVTQLGHTAGSVLDGHVDASLLATLGHSAGGGTAVRVAAADPAVRGWIALAGVPVAVPARPVPSLMISGSADKTVPTSVVRKFYASVTGQKALIVIDGYGHNVFDDICTINHAHGGVQAAIKSLGLPVPPAILQLGTDGCSPPDHYPPTAWPLIDQAVTAQLEYDFYGTHVTVGIGAGVATAFAGVQATWTSAG
jgi:dienelactone hydrolase